MAAAVFDSTRHHSRSTTGSSTVTATISNMCNIPGCNSPKDLLTNDNIATHSMHTIKPYGLHIINSNGSSNNIPMPSSSLNYHHHSLPPTLLHQPKSQIRTNYYNQFYTCSRQNKRKSAVELLAESKPFYVKSEAVLDRNQKLAYRNPVACSTPIQRPTSCLVSPTRGFHTQRNTDYINRRSVSSSSDLLQNKLRKLLNDQGPNQSAPLSIFQPVEPFDVPSQHHRSVNSTAAGAKYRNVSQGLSPKRKNPEIIIPSPPETNSDLSVFFPSAFLSPQSLPPQNVLSDEDSAGFENDPFLTGYQTISPPAEYAEVSSSNSNRYDQSRYDEYTHPPPVEFIGNDYLPSSYNINSHKSLPDLHSQSNRYSPHSEQLSSRGNRSIKSGSSFNHGSIGSSGHFTRKSEPCCKQPLKEPGKLEYFRDSGFSTQHSEDYNVFRYDFIDSQPALPPPLTDQNVDFCPLEFSTPEVPKAFQDDVNDSGLNPIKYSNDQQCDAYGCMQMSTIKTTKIDNCNVLSPNETSPPLGTFKRQKCLRFKNRRSRCSSPNGRNCNYSMNSDDRKPILRSKSDISDRYWNHNEPPLIKPINIGKDKQSPRSDNLSEMVLFFDRLGLSDEEYEEFITQRIVDSKHSSPVFFSDSSTVDSNQLPDSTETQPSIQSYRPPETTSIVERNARIIKWLCNCKKLQMVK